jgi:hypothetical protein
MALRGGLVGGLKQLAHDLVWDGEVELRGPRALAQLAELVLDQPLEPLLKDLVPVLLRHLPGM